MANRAHNTQWSRRFLLRSALYSIGMFLILLAVAALVSSRTQQAELHEIEAANIAKADLAYHLVQGSLEAQMRGLEVIRQHSEAGLLTTDETFDVSAAAIMAATGHFAVIALVNVDGLVLRAWHPWDGRILASGLLGANPDLAGLMRLAASTGEPQVSEELKLLPDKRSIVAFFPIMRFGKLLGFVAAAIHVDELDVRIERLTGNQLSTRLLVGQQAFADAPGSVAAGQRFYPISLYNRYMVLRAEWRLDVRLQPTARADIYWGIALSLLSAGLLFGLRLVLHRGDRSTAMLSSVLQTVPAAVISLDSTRRISVVNSAAEQMFGRQATDMIGQELDILLPSHARERHRQHLETYASSEENVRIMRDWRTVFGQRSCGEQFPVLVSLGKGNLDGDQFHIAVLRDMTEEAKAKEQLTVLLDEVRMQKVVADQANHAKTMFLASMSHELRTPLNAIIGFSEVLQAEMFGPIGNERYRSYIDDICNSGRHLLKLIGDILDQSKIEIGAYQFHIHGIDLTAAAGDALQVIEPLAGEKRLMIRFEEPKKPASAWADERALKQVLLNLLSNAVKFTEPGGTITVAVSPAPNGDAVCIDIHDTGCGMTNEDLERVGMPFVQVGDAYRAEVKGTGLGLAISKKLVQGMSGELKLDSQYGIGTRVSVILPSAAGAEASVSADWRQGPVEALVPWERR